ncbi:hypothetical protein M0R04_12590 [Candidatus Dojkabacteria bacterium]|jgi:hypothetical protein|nr:hypothetical protein [Candidatus Dojkabacteria bacterium]
MNTQTKILSFDLRKNKYILAGNLIGNTFFKEVMPVHFMRIIGGYGISESAFQDILSKECKYIIIKESVTKQNWKSKMSDWIEHCHIADYGSGKQRFLSLKYMKTHKVKLDTIK